MVDFVGYSSPYRKRDSRLSTALPRTCRKPEAPSLDRLNIVLRQRNRPNTQQEMPAESKYSKFSPLPAIKGRPKLLREKTYVVLEPVYVKGPHKEDKIKLPEIKKSSGSGKSSLTSGSPRRATSRGGQLVTPKRNKTLDPETPSKLTRQTFNPNHVAPSSEIPNNVFWFPM